jgi:hypothetical protein
VMCQVCLKYREDQGLDRPRRLRALSHWLEHSLEVLGQELGRVNTVVRGHRVVLLRRTLVGLLKDHAVAASRHDATLNNAASSYTTSVDSTRIAQGPGFRSAGRRRKDACRPPARIAATESGLVHSSVIVTGGNRQATRRAIEANHDLSFWRQAYETERLRLRLLPGLLLS